MPNIASALKSEIARVARRELRAEIQGLKTASSTYRGEIAALKRRIQSLERDLKPARKQPPAVVQPEAEEGNGATRFSAKGFASQRKRLGLSAAEVAILFGASAQSIYNWEEGKARPRAQHMPAIAAFRKLGRRQAIAALEAAKSRA